MITLITDGACRGNPGAGGWAVLIHTADGCVQEFGGAVADTTNNRMELQAVIEGLRRVAPDAPVTVVSDSRYVVDTAQRWIERGRIPDTAANPELWAVLLELAGTRVRWQRVAGHAGHALNERADQIAHAYANGRTPPPPPPLPLDDAAQAADTALVQAVAAVRPAGQTYLSLVRGQLKRHLTWDDCKQRVEGVSGARYKKCRTAQEELHTVRGWGIAPDLLRQPLR